MCFIHSFYIFRLGLKKVYFFPFFPPFLEATLAFLLAMGSAAGFLPAFLAFAAAFSLNLLLATSSAVFLATAA